MTTIIVPLSNSIKNNIKRVWKMSHLAKRFKLFFSRQDLLGNKLIGLDIIKRKLLFLQRNNKRTSCIIVDLENVDSCTLKKQYNSIDRGGLKKRKLHEYLRTIFLELNFKNKTKVVTLSFFEEEKDNKCDIQEVEAKAKEWETTVSKFLKNKLAERA